MFSFWGIEPNKNVELSEFLEWVNSAQGKASRLTFHAMKSIMKLFLVEKIAKKMGKNRFPQTSDVVILESWKLSYIDKKTSKYYPF